MGKRSLKSNGRQRRVSRQDIKQMEKIEALLESVNTESHLEPIITRPVTQPVNKLISTPVTQTIQKATTTITPTPRVEYYLPYPFSHIKASELSLSNHAYQRSLERLKLQRTSESEIAKFLRSKLSKSEYVGQITCTDGTNGEAFKWNDVCIMVTTDLKTLKTVWTVDRMPFNPIMDKMQSLMKKEFRKLDRKEKARIKRLQLFTYEVNSEISQLKLKAFKSRSQSVKLTCQGRIRDLEVSLQEFKNDITQIQTNKRQLAKSLMSII